MIMGKNCLIIEDNYVQREYMKRLVQELSSEVKVYDVDNLQEAYQILLENTIDLFIIDIVLDNKKKNDVSGVKLANVVRDIPYYAFTPIIFVTSLIDPKLFAYTNLHCFSYLEKPFSQAEAKSVIRDAMEYSTPKKELDTFCLRKGGILFPIQVDNIIYIESLNRSIIIYRKDDKSDTMPYMTCRQVLQEAGNSSLIQCNRSVIVNKNYIWSVDRANRYIVLRECGKRVDIGVTYLKKVMNELCNF